MKKLIAVALLMFAGMLSTVTPVSAQLVGLSDIVTTLEPCNTSMENRVAYVTDATNATTLGAGGGSAKVWVMCVSGTWTVQAVAAVADLSGYVQNSEAAQVSIAATGAGNDVTVTAADDIILTPTDALTVAPGGNASIATTAGSVTIQAGGTTQDVTVNSVDDIILTPTDDLTANPTGLVNITPGESFAVTTTAGAVTLTAGGTTQDISLISVDQVILDGAGGADELVVDDDEVKVQAAAAFYFGGASAPPVACGAGTAGAIYFDTDIAKSCICNGTNYVLMNDDSTTTGCS